MNNAVRLLSCEYTITTAAIHHANLSVQRVRKLTEYETRFQSYKNVDRRCNAAVSRDRDKLALRRRSVDKSIVGPCSHVLAKYGLSGIRKSVMQARRQNHQQAHEFPGRLRVKHQSQQSRLN